MGGVQSQAPAARKPALPSLSEGIQNKSFSSYFDPATDHSGGEETIHL